MKLLILLSIIASSYADKLDRTYLPPSNAATAGVSPGALTAPGFTGFAPTGQSNEPFGQQSTGQPLRPYSAGQANQQIQGPQQSVNFESNKPFGSSDANIQKPSPVYGPANGRLSQVNTGFDSGFGPRDSQSVNQQQSLGISNAPTQLAQQPSRNSFESNAASPFTYNEPSGQNYVDTSSPTESERPQAAADRNAEILRYVNENDGDRFTYSFETSNGISAEEAGVAAGGVKAQGGFSYTGDDGKAYTITYTADEQGYQPQGEHLPTPHPIPEEILKSIEKNAQAAAAGTQEGAYRPEDYESEDNSQGYSGASPVNNPQGIQQFSGQQYNPSSDRLSSTQFGFPQAKPERQNLPTGQDNYANNKNGQINVESVGPYNQNLGSNDQAQSLGRPGYQYSRPQNTQDTSLPGLSKQTFGTETNQRRPQSGSQFSSNSPFMTSGNGQNSFNAKPGAQNRPQDFFKPSGVSKYQQGAQTQFSKPQNYNQGSSGYQYQPGTSGFGPKTPSTYPKQPSLQNQGTSLQSQNQYQTNPASKFSSRPSVNQQYQSQNAQGSLPSQNGFDKPNTVQNQATVPSNSNSAFGFPSTNTKQSAPIQAPYQYQRPTPSFNQKPESQNGFSQATQGQVPSANKPFGSPQTSYSQPIQSQGPFQLNQSAGQGQTTPQNQGSSPSFNRPNQVQGSTYPSANHREQFSGPRQPPSYNPEEGYKY